MDTLIERFGKLITASILLMEIGAIVALFTPLVLLFCDVRIDIFGALIFTTGALLCAAGFVIRKINSKKQ